MQSNHISFPPIPIVVRCILHTVIIEALHHVVQYAMPHLLKPFGLAKPLYDRGADCVVCTDERREALEDAGLDLFDFDNDF